MFPSLRAIIDRSREIYNPDGASAAGDSYNETLYRWRFKDKRLIRFGSIQHENDVTDWQGQPHDLYGFDEITEFTEKQFRFVTGWNRTTLKGQRCRVICTGNPPTSAEGEWVIRFWAPWLDESYPNPANPGELRWFTTEDGKDEEAPDGRPFVRGSSGERIYDFDPEKYKVTDVLSPRSRTFIPARVADNPYLVASGYVSTLQALPEPLRSQMLYGDFRSGRKDDAFQAIPSEWVRLAQQRWRDRPAPTTPMNALGVDVARGGKDKTVLSARHGNWFGTQWTYPGTDTPNGDLVATLALKHRGSNATCINIDVLGVGSSPYDTLHGMKGVKIVALNSSAGSDAMDRSGQLGFINKRAEWWWKLREALEPGSGQDLALPPDPELLADLCAPKWKTSARGIQIESKDEVKKRIGRSPDKGDSLVYAHANEGIRLTSLERSKILCTM